MKDDAMVENRTQLEKLRGRLAHYRPRRLPGNWRRAAVLIAIVVRETPALLLTLRTQGLSSHAGQVAFPGGKRDPGESLEACALREAWEEVGLEPTRVELIGRLSEVISVTGIAVTPFVGLVREPPSFIANPYEVASVFEVPLSALAKDPRQHTDAIDLEDGLTLFVPSYAFDGYTLWGLSAMMVVELLDAGLGVDIGLDRAPPGAPLRRLTRRRQSPYPTDYWQ
ncbi:CoA pyrophosphatase [Halotalea alkalilenta]|uniref:CoA pyrophosphatase n=1 Tax=Halotalea alkalilenta TaxID=376489 RepID=UPI000482C52A|nr:CoA pyrophosphatase [Halotalea alkalilenta]